MAFFLDNCHGLFNDWPVFQPLHHVFHRQTSTGIFKLEGNTVLLRFQGNHVDDGQTLHHRSHSVLQATAEVTQSTTATETQGNRPRRTTQDGVDHSPDECKVSATHGPLPRPGAPGVL